MLLKANAIGGPRSKTSREYLEKNYSEETIATQEGTLRLAVKALLEVAQSGSKNIEVSVMKKDTLLKVISPQCHVCVCLFLIFFIFLFFYYSK